MTPEYIISNQIEFLDKETTHARTINVISYVNQDVWNIIANVLNYIQTYSIEDAKQRFGHKYSLEYDLEVKDINNLVSDFDLFEAVLKNPGYWETVYNEGKEKNIYRSKIIFNTIKTEKIISDIINTDSVVYPGCTKWIKKLNIRGNSLK